MKDFRWFRSQPFESQLSINPAAVKATVGSPKPVSAAKINYARSSISFNGLILGTTALALLALAVIACSREAHKLTSTAANVPKLPAQPLVAPMPAAPAPLVATADAKPVVKKSAHKRPDKVVYKNDVYGVSFQYPRRYALKTGDEAIIDWFGSQPVGMNFADGGGVAVAAVELPRGLYPGTDYRDAFFTVSVNRNLSEAQCSQFAETDSADTDEEPVAPSNVNFGGQVYSQTSVFDGKAFEQAYGRFYHVFNGGACYEMALGLETAGYGAVEGVTPVDRDEVFHKLESMLASVRLHAEEKMTETFVASSNPGTTLPKETPAAPPTESEGAH
jgi:hypothetical protein